MDIVLFLVYALLLVLIFYLLAKVCDEYFVESLEVISAKLKLSSDVAGATFMAVGSSAPELFTAAMALIIPGNHEQIGAGTIVGSAIFNILVIIGVSTIVARSVLSWQYVLRDSVFYIISIILLLFTFQDGIITATEAFTFVGMYILYIFVVFHWKKILPYKDLDVLKEVEEDMIEQEKVYKKDFFGMILFGIDTVLSWCFPARKKQKKQYMRVFIISILCIGVLSWGLVELAVQLAHILHISDSIVALTILAGGTSIPDLLSSVIVARKGQGGMAISNAIGSNIFDILFGLGLPWLIFALVVGNVEVSTENLISSVVLLFATVIMVIFLMIFHRFKMPKKAGYTLVSLYVVYIGYMVYTTLYPEGQMGLEELRASIEALL